MTICRLFLRRMTGAGAYPPRQWKLQGTLGLKREFFAEDKPRGLGDIFVAAAA